MTNNLVEKQIQEYEVEKRKLCELPLLIELGLVPL